MLTKTKRRLTLASSTLWPKNLFIATFIFCLGLVCPPKASAVDPVHYDVTADTYIKTMAPGYNYGSESEMELRYWCGESYVPGDNSTVCYHQWLVVRPDVSFIPPGATIESAKLRLHLKENSGAFGCHYRVTKITQNWRESTVTYNNRPTSVNAGVTGTFYGGDQNVLIDITNLVKEWYSGQSPNYGIIIADREISQRCTFSTREGPYDDRPWLSVRFTTPTPTPVATFRILTLPSPTPTPTVSIQVLNIISPTPTPTPTYALERIISPTPTPAPIVIIDFGRGGNEPESEECTDSEDYARLNLKSMRYQPQADGAIFEWETTACQSDGSLGDERASGLVFVDPSADSSEYYLSYQYRYGSEEIEFSSHQVRVDSLEPGTTYKFRIYSKDADGSEAVSNQGEFTTLLAGSGSDGDGSSGSGEEDADASSDSVISRALARMPFIGAIFGGSDEIKQEASGAAQSTPGGQKATQGRGIGSDRFRFFLTLPVLAILVVIAHLLFKKKGLRNKDEDKKDAKDANDAKDEVEGSKKAERQHVEDRKEVEVKAVGEEKKPVSRKKKIIIGGVAVFLLLAVVLPAFSFLGELAFMGIASRKSQKMDKIVEEFLTKKNQAASVPVATGAPSGSTDGSSQSFPILKYAEVPEEFKNISINCEDTSFAPGPLRGSSFYCENVYNVEPEKLLNNYQQSGKEHLVLYGESSYFDCPVHLGQTQTLINKCVNAALFLDYWQMTKMSELMGVPAPTNKLYVYYAKTKDEVANYCNLPTASACFRGADHALYLTSPSSVDKFYRQQWKASVYEGENHAIEYSFNMQWPSNCYATSVHEMIHYFTNQYLGHNIARDWFEEGITYLLDPLITKDLCPPGPTFTNVVRKEGERVEAVSNFDLTVLDREEPLNSAIESYTEGNKCMKAILMEVGRHYREQGPSIIPNFYSEIKNMNKSYEHDFARALYLAEGSPEWLKTRLTQAGCDLNPNR